MKIALVSLDQYWEGKEKNKQQILNFFEKGIKNKGLDLVVFPEMTLTGFTMNAEANSERISNSSSLKFFINLAKCHSCFIIFGVILKDTLNKFSNSAIVISPNGQIISHYKKIHPFSFAGEDLIYHSGEEINLFEIQNQSFGLSICYDLRFPELFQGLSKKANVIINIANWPQKRVEHWRTLLKARAIENQVFFIGVNRTGSDGNNISYEKSSSIFNSNGDIVHPIYTFPEIDIYDIDITEVNRTRESFPVKKDRKIDFYKSIL